MGRIVRSVSLDAETDKMAGEMGNFSKWVRVWIRQHHQRRLAQAIKSTTHNAPRRFYFGDSTLYTEICWPYHPSGCCVLCWPDGPPNDGAYAEYVLSLKRYGDEMDRPEGLGWPDPIPDPIEEEIEKGLSWIQAQEILDESSKGKKGRFARFLNWFSR
jgi:hypothetical protein